MGTGHLTLVAPYLAYMRQDMAFAPGEAVSQRVIGRWLADLFDGVVTIDPRLHRVGALREAVPAAASIAVSAAPFEDCRTVIAVNVETPRPATSGPQKGRAMPGLEAEPLTPR